MAKAKKGGQQKQKKLQKTTEEYVAMDADVRRAAEERRMAEHYTSVTPKRKPVSNKSGIGICPKCRKNEPGGAVVQSTPHFRMATPPPTPCDYHCGLCPPDMAFWSVDRQDLIDHKKEQHLFTCGKCQIGLLSQDQLTRHRYAKHNPLHYCMPCERVYTSIQGYRSHETTEMHRGKEAVVNDVLTELGLEQLVKKRRVPWEARGVPDALKTQNAFEQGCFVVHNLPKMKEVRRLGEKIKQGLLAFPTPAASVASEDVEIEEVPVETPPPPSVYQSSLDTLACLSPHSRALAYQLLDDGDQQAMAEESSLPPQSAEEADDEVVYLPNIDVISVEFMDDYSQETYGIGVPMFDLGYGFGALAPVEMDTFLP